MKKQLQILAAGGSLSQEDSAAVFTELLDPESAASDAQIGAYLFATALRAPSIDELFAGAMHLRKHMRRFARGIDRPLLDTCGTGGSGYSAFNTSTAVALVCAAAGQPVAKHGNRAASSTSGSADVLEALGVSLSADEAQQQQQLEQSGFVFLFAPDHHPAAKRVALLRKELGLRSIFNYLGPLVNPASAEYQLLGVSREDALEPMAGALAALGVRRALVVRGRDGLDELSCGALSDVFEIEGDAVRRYELDSRLLGVQQHPVSAIAVSSAEDSAEKLRSVLAGEQSPYREVVCLNAGAALYICGKSETIIEGVTLARRLLDQGGAARVLSTLQKLSQ